MKRLIKNLKDCQICAERFARTHTQHRPNPVVWFQPGARLLIAGQAPGMRVHQSNRPFWDQSGKRLRQWLGLSEDAFYDRSRVAIVPMAFCFPGYDAKGSDLPPPRICAETWRKPIIEGLDTIEVTLLIGGYAQSWHLEGKLGVTERVRNWRNYAPDVFCLPHPSWRNTGWLKKNPWFEAETIPALQSRVQEVMHG